MLQLLLVWHHACTAAAPAAVSAAVTWLLVLMGLLLFTLLCWGAGVEEPMPRPGAHQEFHIMGRHNHLQPAIPVQVRLQPQPDRLLCKACYLGVAAGRLLHTHH